MRLYVIFTDFMIVSRPQKTQSPHEVSGAGHQLIGHQNHWAVVAWIRRVWINPSCLVARGPLKTFIYSSGSPMVLVIIVGQDFLEVADYWCHRCILRYGWGFSIMKGWNYDISEFSIHVEMSMTWRLWLACFPRNDKKHQCTTNRWAQRLDYWTGSKVCSKVPCGASYVVLQRRGMDW